MASLMDSLGAAYFAVTDGLRHAQANALDALGPGPHETGFHVRASGPHWRLRRYGGLSAGPPLLIVPAPIKRRYIFDLTPSVSAVRTCLNHGLGVYLVEWTPPSSGNGVLGLDEYADEAIAACVAIVSDEAQGAQPFLMGHSLGGTLATIFCALEPEAAKGLVLLGAPLCFEQGCSRFGDAVVAMVPPTSSETDIIAGSLLSQASAVASPDTFLWARCADAAFSLADPFAWEMHARIERWALDETALPRKLVSQMVRWLYCENRLCRGTLTVRGRIVGPAAARTPTLAIVNTADEIGPLASVAPFLARMATADTRIIEHPGEVGVSLQHLAVLASRQAFAHVWPQIMS